MASYASADPWVDAPDGAVTFSPSMRVVMPPAPNDVSSVPSVLKRARCGAAPPVYPAATILPSGWMSGWRSLRLAGAVPAVFVASGDSAMPARPPTAAAVQPAGARGAVGVLRV